MSIAKKLQGGGGAFGALAQGTSRGDEVRARSEALDATGRVRRASSAPVSSIVFNPLNPRKTIDSESIDELAESLTRRQIVPVTVVSRGAFLDAHPDQAEAVGEADFVALDGNRRLRAAQQAGLKTLRVDLNDELVSRASDMVEAALIANAHREDVSPFEEAQAIEQLLDTVYEGNQAAVARALGKSRAWVGQRLALLHLSPELQEQAGAGELAIEDARRIGAEARAGKITRAEQHERAEAAKLAAAEKQAAKAARTANRADRSAGETATERTSAPTAGNAASARDDVNGVYVPGLPDQRDARTDERDRLTSSTAELSTETDRQTQQLQERDRTATPSGGAGVPDWRDLEGVATWLCRFLQPDELRVVATKVLDRLEEFASESAAGR
ncbi:ParB/RepB/Spo0J family partition protein [Kitasatospora cathayae]|uniref:ParB/RepB/Spo0J family partition protein n=1 Tax=Kitasatospora cathayae TaxID=3004092 RepID=A0ABY7QI20_9ACTN|nr:ParB/RepB/Spo0J family partition protein [Kitasatospora sp. HUAS 3-15]WBP92007.1 ParB/RepB/Spo0J family partition protein [Kitasatospora sp. HUAS 3-15]